MVPTIYILDDDVVYAKLLAANLGTPGRVRTRVFERAEDLLAQQSDDPADAVQQRQLRYFRVRRVAHTYIH